MRRVGETVDVLPTARVMIGLCAATPNRRALSRCRSVACGPCLRHPSSLAVPAGQLRPSAARENDV